MSTRANIIIKDGDDSLIFYRHSDGYPKGTMPTLEKFLNLVREGKIRDNIWQASGWLILIGAIEYKKHNPSVFTTEKPEDLNPADWKAGAYEPTTEIHGDIEYLYTVDLAEKTITVKHV